MANKEYLVSYKQQITKALNINNACIFENIYVIPYISVIEYLYYIIVVNNQTFLSRNLSSELANYNYSATK